MTEEEKELIDRKLTLRYSIFKTHHNNNGYIVETKRKLEKLEGELELVKKKLEELKKLKEVREDFDD